MLACLMQVDFHVHVFAFFGKRIHACLIQAALLFRGGHLDRFDSGFTIKTLNIGTPRPATVVLLNIKPFNFTMK